ncbi:chorismate mutase [Treponema bryantii]|uniref:chorismate mutase n=1 Tax=Treponema bryantii TaxID=163 RepID=A0A1H9ANA1_9SPIR|nr:chorismate mutase [Treponema bryantii]SEP78021.1 chorismate mutase [Treponema bryantii]
MEKRLAAFRGAVCVENTPENITENVCLMCRELFTRNSIKAEDIVSLQFTITNDITKLNPATALRRGDCGLDITSVPLFCSQEAFIEGGMPLVVRALLTTYVDESSAERHNVYLNGAEKLRPDFSNR